MQEIRNSYLCYFVARVIDKDTITCVITFSAFYSFLTDDSDLACICIV